MAEFKDRLCKLAKNDVPKDEFRAYSELVDSPRFICTRCGRASNRKRYVCQGHRI